MTDAKSTPTNRSGTLTVAVGLCAILSMGLTGVGLTTLVTGSTPMPLSLAFAITGLLEAVTALYAYLGRRIAWAFSCSINGTLAIVGLLGIPKLAHAVSISNSLASIPTFLLVTATMFMAMSESEMR